MTAALLLLAFYASPSQILAQETIKYPNVSGVFYPADKKQLKNTIATFMQNANTASAQDEHIFGIISPHAGYIYSGPVAAHAYRALQDKKYTRVILIGPSHYQWLDKIAVFEKGYFRTPLGDVAIDAKTTQALINGNKNIVNLPLAFEQEHALEVQIPFLQESLKDFKIVPIMLSNPSYKLCEELAAGLAGILSQDKDNTLIIASTDMSHYHSQAAAQKIDQATLATISRLDAEGLFRDCQLKKSELCGSAAVVTLILTMKKLGITNTKLLKYATSFNTTRTNNNKVVGYASIIFYKPQPDNTANKKGGEMLTEEQKKSLLEIAKMTISEYIKEQTTPQINDIDPAFLEKRGAFVTLKKKGNLRGCIGRIVGDTQLVRVVQEMAIEAATRDPRFEPVREDELESIVLEISVLSPLKQIFDIDEIEVGKHGLLIRKNFGSGLLLPQVATEYGWSKEEFLKHTCLKAGLPPDAWMKNAQIYIFSAEVFGEE